MSPSQRSFGTRNRISYSFQHCIFKFKSYVVDRSSRFNMYIQMFYRLKISKVGEKEDFRFTSGSEFWRPKFGAEQMFVTNTLVKTLHNKNRWVFQPEWLCCFPHLLVSYGIALSFITSVRLYVHLSRFVFACIYCICTTLFSSTVI